MQRSNTWSRHFRPGHWLMILGLLVVTACSNGATSGDAPAITRFEVTPAELQLGDSVTIEWKTSGATSSHTCKLYAARPGKDPSDPSESEDVDCNSLKVDTPNELGTHRYSLQIMKGTQPIDTDFGVVDVVDVSDSPTITSFDIAPTEVQLGDSVAVKWTTSQTTSAHVCKLYIARPGSTSSEVDDVSCNSLVVDTPGQLGNHRYALQIESSSGADVLAAEFGFVAVDDVDLAWRTLGPPLSQYPDNTRATRSSLVFDQDDVPHVAWYESTVPAEDPGSVDVVLVKRWDGASWQLLGAPLSAGDGVTHATWPSLQIDGDGDPIVAFAMHDIHVRKWTGSSWSAVGSPLSAYGGAAAHTPSLAVDATGDMAVAWTESDGTGEHVHVAMWNGAAWEQLGGKISANQGLRAGDRPSVAIDANGSPIVAWSEFDGSNQTVHVSTWTGGSWQPLGTGLSAYSGVTPAKGAWLASAGGTTVIAWFEDDGAAEYVHVHQWSGSAWEQLGERLSKSGTADNASWPSVELDATGRPIVSWKEEDIHVSRWSGTQWDSVGQPLSAFPGSTRAYRPSVALDSSGQPAVSWHENDGTTDDIHVSRYGP